MNACTHANEAPAPLDPAPRRRGLVFRLYTSNPFYVISADLVFVGLRMSFDTQDRSFGTWALMLGLAGYTLLLATTACLLIRYGKVWDDVRSLLLLVVMMFLAMSVTFDGTLARDPGVGAVCYLGGLLFAVAVTEAVLRGIRLAMPPWFRVPYYLLLGLFFVYPVALSPLLSNPEGAPLQWALFGFSPIAGLLALTLLPAIRRGPEYARENGSPWAWPFYPWVLFGLLGLVVCARASYLCVSLHFVDRTLSEGTNTIFGAYFLVPFLLAVAVLILELGVVARSRATMRAALVVPVLLVALACLGHSPDAVHQRFLENFRATLGGTPLFLTLLAAASFYAVATLRGIPEAYAGLVAALVALAGVGPGSHGFDRLSAPQVWPIAVLGLIESGLAIRRRDSRRGTVAAACVVAAVTIGLPGDVPPVSRGVIAFHVAIAAAMAIGAIFDDEQALILRGLSACALILAGLVAASGGGKLPGELPPGLVQVYPLAAALLGLVYGSLVGDRLFYVQAAATLATFLTAAGARGYLALRPVVAGLDHIAGGLAFFLLAALISLRKAGVLARLLSTKWRWRENDL